MSKETTTKVGDVSVTLNPSQQAVKAALKDVTVIDALGRSIRLKKPAVLAQYRIVDALGDSAKNQAYMSMVLPLIYVNSIDGNPVILPSSKTEVEALIQKLDEEGISAVMTGVQANFAVGDPDVDRERIKNS